MITPARLLQRLYWNVFVLWHVRREFSLPYWPLERTRAVQSRRVRSIVAHAQRTVPFYRELMRQRRLRPEDFRSADDLVQLPVIERDQLAEEPRRFASEAYPDERTVVCLSSGSYGANRSVRYDRAAAFIALAAGHRSRLVMGRLTGHLWRQRQLTCGWSALSSSRQLRTLYEELSWVPRRLDYQREYSVAAGRPEEHAARLRRLCPHVVGGYGMYLGWMFRAMHEQGLEYPKPALVVFWGEGMPDADRRFIEDELGILVRGGYAATEALRLGWQCERREGYHVDLDMVALRVVDAGGHDVPAGQAGELLVSNLTNRATVLLNYRLGDIVTPAAAPCPCGRTLPLLARVDGRSDDLVRHPDGRSVHVWPVLAGVQALPGVAQNQLVQSPGNRFHLRLVLRRGTDAEATTARAGDELRAVLGPAAEITVEHVETLAHGSSGKVRLVVSEPG